MQSRSRDTDIENKYIYTRKNWEIGVNIYTLLILCIK